MTPAERKAMAEARNTEAQKAIREEQAEALKRHQAKLRAITKRDSTMPKGKR